MNQLVKDLKNEIASLLKGSTIDAVIPPFVYILMNQYFTISIAGISAVLIALFITLYRIATKKPYIYALVGLIGVAVAVFFALISNRSSDYFIPQLIGSGALIFFMVLSLILRKPFAAWLSHLSRGWNINWFWRDDIKPAYTEVTLVWVVFAIVKLSIQIYLWQSSSISTLFVVNSLLGMPAITVVLIATYIYGIFRLKSLKGPSVDEFNEDKKAPWIGQRKGF